MATTAQIASIQQLYIAYFNRPADAAGLDFWAKQITNGGSLANISATFAATPEYKATFANLSNDQVVSAIYQNLFNRAPDAAGLKFWSDKLTDKALTIDNVVAEVSKSAQQNANGGPDTVAINSKVAAAVAFTDYLNTNVDARIAYSSGSANSVGVNYIHSVIDDASLAAAKTSLPTTVSADLLNGGTVTGSTFVLTSTVDAIVGTAGNDVVNSVITNDGNSLTTLDSIKGNGGTDTLNIVDNRTGASAAAIVQADISPAGAAITGVEVLSITSNSAIGATGVGAIDTTGISGLTNVNLVSGGGVFVTAAATAAVKVTSAVGDVEVNGGKSADVAGAGLVTISGDSLVSATVTGGAGAGNAILIDDQGEETLTSVTLKSIGADASITSDSVANLTLSGANAAVHTVTVNNTTANHTLNLTASGAGLKSDGTAATITVVDTAATTVAVTTTAKSNISLVGSTAITKVTAAGSGSLALDLDGVNNTAVTSFDGSTATGNLTLANVAAATVAVSTGAGNDSFTTTQIAKATFNTGAGNDKITVATAIAAGSTINLGAGNDVLLFATGGSVAASGSTAATTTVIDGGDGIDSVSALLLNVGNGAQFVNFEAIDLTGNATPKSVDVALLTGSTINALTLNGGTGGVSVSNVAVGASLTVAGAASNTTTIGVAGVGGSSDVFNIAFNGAAASSAPGTPNVTAGTVVVEGIETVNIASTGGANTWNSIALTDAKLKSVVITGDQALNLTFAGTVGTNPSAAGGAVSLIDGSAANGKLNINTTNVTADSASAGLTIKGGSAADTITLGGHAATVNGGAGNDTIVTSATFSSTLTGGAGNDTFNVAATASTVAANTGYKFTTITDLTAGDVLKFAATEVNFQQTKVDVSAASDFAGALTLAVDAAGAGNTVDYFVYGGNTYVVDVTALNGTHALAATDVVVKLSGVVDLSHSSIALGVLTVA
jgi:S-layer protein